MAFTNTVETVGDAALTRSIIDRSITELNCNITTSIRQQAFRACSALESVNFPNVTSVALGAFYNCTALAKAEFGSAVAFANNAFYGCTALTALILRSTDALCTISGTPFASSAIASGTGYIYVPKALVDQYKASWTAYAAQVRAIEDYPGIADPYSWEGVAANIADGSYKSVYKIGDLVPLDLGTEGVVNMQIAAFDADDLADGSGKAPISWVSMEALKTNHIWNPALVTNDDGTYQEGTGTIGGWPKSELRAYLNNTILPMIPVDVRALIQTITMSSDGYDVTGAIVTYTTEETIWLPNYSELSGKYQSALGTSAQRKKKNIGSTAFANWWLRSGYRTTIPHCVTSSGSVSYNITSEYNYGSTILCFCT